MRPVTRKVGPRGTRPVAGHTDRTVGDCFR
jgi:hypothetical protein